MNLHDLFVNVLDVVHKFVRDVYYKRFPELESLVHLPLEYVRTVKVCSNVCVVEVLLEVGSIWCLKVFPNCFRLCI